jgi:hypothetical protein
MKKDPEDKEIFEGITVTERFTQEEVVDYLIQRGCRELNTSSSKYRRLSNMTKKDCAEHYWVDKRGNVGVGRSFRLARDITDYIHLFMGGD